MHLDVLMPKLLWYRVSLVHLSLLSIQLIHLSILWSQGMCRIRDIKKPARGSIPPSKPTCIYNQMWAHVIIELGRRLLGYFVLEGEWRVKKGRVLFYHHLMHLYHHAPVCVASLFPGVLIGILRLLFRDLI